MREEYLPHYNDRKTDIDMLMFHCSALSGEEILHTLDSRELSSHYISDENAQIIKVVNEDKRAYHAGLGFWKGLDSDLNSHTIGIELSSFSLGQTPYTPQQIQALITLSRELIAKHHIRPDMIVGHSDTAPLRKADPGKAFPWQQLAQEGIGIWYKTEDANQILSDNIPELLNTIGYDTRSPQAIYASAYAFCRRFAPQFVHTDDNPLHLVDHILPDNFDFMNTPEFLQILKSVTYSFSVNA